MNNVNKSDIEVVNVEEANRILELLKKRDQFLDNHKLTHLMYQDESVEHKGVIWHKRDLYPMHQQFFRAGTRYFERGVVSGNQVGKTVGAGGYESAVHLTGLYPHWWEGIVYSEPIKWVAAGDSAESTRDIIQDKLLGSWMHKECIEPGLIPPERIISTEARGGSVKNAYSKAYIEGTKSRVNSILFRAYKQGRKAAEGLTVHGVWIDEEPPQDFYNEIKIRCLRIPNARIICTFTPLEGYSSVLEHFMLDGKIPPYDPDLI